MLRIWLCPCLALTALGVLGARAGVVPEDAIAPGLMARYSDGARTVSEVVFLPELGLLAGESPHPEIAPDFRAVFEGLLVVAQPGTYEFSTDGELSIAGERITDEVALKAGQHVLSLRYQRGKGPVRFGLSWQSEHFVEEPVPPTVLWHEKEALAGMAPAAKFPSPPYRIAQAMGAMKCASCHEPNFLATMHHKFAPDALLTHMRHANPMKWYGAMTGPLLEESEALTQLAVDLQKLPAPARQRGKTGSDASKGLQMVGAQGGLACIACHDIKHHRTAAESKGPNLAYLTQRVSYDWFVRWMSNPQRLKPGVAMPAFFMAQPPEQQQENIDALWDYLKQGDKMELPAELIADPQQFILKPTATPMVNRVYMRLPDGRELMRAICVGLPNGVSYCFDAETCRLAYVWTGGYLDMSPHWKNQSLHPIPTVGETFHLPSVAEGLTIGDESAVFRGYELVAGVPRFEFASGDAVVRLLIDAPTPDVVRQTYTIGKRSAPVTFAGPPVEAPVAVTASRGSWTGTLLTIEDVGEIELVVKLEGKK